MFAILATAALPAVYLTALTAVFAVFLLYATVLTSFAAAVALDFQRQVAQCCDVLCCYTVPSAAGTSAPAVFPTEAVVPEAKTSDPSSGFADAPSSARPPLPNSKLRELLWNQVYKPLLQSRFGRGVVLAVALVWLVLASLGLANLKLGLGLTEFFPEGSQVSMCTYLT